MEKIILEDFKPMFQAVCDGIISQKDILTKADQDLGDGDHGIGMARGFNAVKEKMETENPNSVSAFFVFVGTTLMMSMGGSSGAIYGTLFRAGGKNIATETEFGAVELSQFLTDGLEGVQARGSAKVGDKTVVDALEPAAKAAQANKDKTILESFEAVVLAAREGVETTKDMIATTGRAKTLGERCLGFPDPGAMSTTYILEHMLNYIKTK